jgi:hypothetical protein
METITIQPIETNFMGYRFRSRLEARWTKYLNTLGIKWIYEFEGYNIPLVGKYLPDFWLPELNCFAEVKPTIFTETEYRKCRGLEKPCLLLDTPWPQAVHGYYATRSVDEDSYSFYLSGDEWGRVIIETSQHKKRLWYLLGEKITDYHLDIIPETNALSARFEFGENGL